MRYDATYLLRCPRTGLPAAAGAVLLTICIARAPVAHADRLLVENPGPILISFAIAEIAYGVESPGARQAGFEFDSIRPEACRDGVNNDDRRAIGLGIQDSHVDYPADPDCTGPEDDSEDKPGYQPREAVTLTGTIDSEGVFHIPAAGIIIPPRYMQSDQSGLGGDRVVVNTFEATHDATGRLDPYTGEMAIRLRYRMKIHVEGSGRFSGPGDSCYLGSESEPHDILLRTGTAVTSVSTHGVGGHPYVWRDGTFAVTGTNVSSVPRATCCGFFCFGDAQVSDSFGVPAGPGTMTLLGSGRIMPAPIPAVRAIHVRAAESDSSLRVVATSASKASLRAMDRASVD